MFNSSYTKIGERIDMTIRMQEHGPDVIALMKSVMENGVYGNTDVSEVRDKMYGALKKRYDLRDWFVVVYQSNIRSMAEAKFHQFDGRFYWVTDSYFMTAAAMSFPTKLNTQSAFLVAPRYFPAGIDNICGKTNQVSAQQMFNAAIRASPNFIGSVNYGAIAKSYFSGGPGVYIGFNVMISSKFGPLVQGTIKNCDETFNSHLSYQPYALFILPETRRFTIPEKE